MALDPRIKRSSISKDLSTIFIQDVSGDFGDLKYVTEDGVTYTETTNTWGYGGDNPLKVDLGKIFIAEYMATSGTVYTEPSAYLANADEFLTVSFPYEKDGWYRIHYLGVPVYDVLEAVTEGMVRFFPSETALPYYGEIKVLEGGEWLVIEAKQLLTEHLESITITKYLDTFLPYKVDQKQAQLHRQAVLDLITQGNNPTKKKDSCYGCDESGKGGDTLEQRLSYLSEIATAAFCAGYKHEAQRIIEAAGLAK
jgi:hypothetical protein